LGEPFEIIVVWSGDASVLPEIEAGFPGARSIGRLERIPTGLARNLGLKLALAPIVAFLAADCTVPPDWLGRRLDGHRRGFRLVGGAVLEGGPWNRSGRANHLLEYSEFPAERPRQILSGRPLFNLSYDRSVFRRHGLFDETLASGEDVLYNWRLARAGETFLFDPSIRMRHRRLPGFVPFLRHQYGHGRAYARLCLGHDYLELQGEPRLPFGVILVIYPVVRLVRLVDRVRRWQSRRWADLIMLGPWIALGLAAFSLGQAREALAWGRGGRERRGATAPED
jgi:GT2 family glycosyltransferase